MIRKINDVIFSDIADAIREKNGKTDTYKPAEMPEAILAIEGGGTGGGGAEDYKVLTPDELYAENRPADWPILPDPTQDNEIYYLCRTREIGQVVLPKTQGEATFLVEAGYIDDNGAFVAVHSVTGHAGGIWSDTGAMDPSGNTLWDSRMDTYHVIRTTGGDTTYEYCSSSTDAPNSRMSQVLEIKARGENLAFNSTRSSMGNNSLGFKNCAFITLYGPQNWKTAENKFYYYHNLICLRFDSDENNMFYKTSSLITTAKNMFYYCRNLRYAYPITNNWGYLTTVLSMYLGCYSLKEVTIEGDKITSANSLFSGNLDKVCFKVPALTSGTPSAAPVKHYTDLDLSGYTAKSYQYNWTYNSEVVENLKLSPIDFSATNSGVGTYKGSEKLRRIIMSPEQTGDKMPTSWGIYLKNSSYKDIKDFVDSLPTTTAGNVITIYNNWLAIDIPPEILQIATDKGYTLAAAVNA